MRYLLDSSMIVAAIKGRLPVVVKLSTLKPDDVAVSIIGRMEAEIGLRGNARVQGKYARLLRDFLANVRVLDFGMLEAQQAMNLGTYLQQGDEKLDAYGLLIAGTALAHQLTLVTEDTAIYVRVPGLETENWLRMAA